MLARSLLSSLFPSLPRSPPSLLLSSSSLSLSHAYDEHEHRYTTGRYVTGMSVKDSDVFRNIRHEYRVTRRYIGPVKGIILDWAGTVVDCGVYSPVVVFLEGFKEEGVPVTIDEARQPMGTHKKVHLRKITEIPTVRERWFHHFKRFPTEDDVERMFRKFVPLQLSIISRYSKMIPGAVDVIDELQKKRNIKIGSTTGYTSQMMDILKVDAAEQGYVPDCIVTADQVPQARPFPYMVWSNAIQLDINPISAIVKVDDTVDGVLEGVTAGCWSVGIAKTGNYMGLNEEELKDLEQRDPALFKRKLDQSYGILSNAGAHYVIDDINGLPRVIDDIERRLAQGEVP